MQRFHFRQARILPTANGRVVEFQISGLPQGLKGVATVAAREQSITVSRIGNDAARVTIQRYDLSTDAVEKFERNWSIGDRHGQYAAEVSARNAATELREFVKQRGGVAGIVAALRRGDLDSAAVVL